MKKLFSIVLSTLILVSGMHVSMATHICQGEVTSKKLSFSGSITSCSMESDKQECPIHDTLNSNCCQNKIVVYSIDNNYQSSSYKVQELTKSTIQNFIPLVLTFNTFAPETNSTYYTSPPDAQLISQVSLPEICSFRI